MRKPLITLVILFGLTLLTSQVQAQFEDVIKYQLNEALKTHLVGVSPTRNCELNAVKFKYSNSMKIEKSQRVEGNLRVWGKAKTSYKSLYNGAGNKVVDFYAEVKRVDVGQFEVVKLRWKVPGNCMKMTTLMQKQ
jgi:hypothetical protein